MITELVLAYFNPERNIIIEANSSGYATRGLLLQKNDNNFWKPVAYYAKKHNSSEANYPIYDKKLLAIINCIKAWEPELKAVKYFKILTDHRNLRYFYTEKRLSEKQIRWSEYLSEFNFRLEWKPGSKNGGPDALSKREQNLPEDGSDERIRARFRSLFKPENYTSTVTIITIESPKRTIDFEREVQVFEDEKLQQFWFEARRSDALYQEMLTLVLNKAKQLLMKIHKLKVISINECIFNNKQLLCFRDRIWVPDLEPLRTSIIQIIHDFYLTNYLRENLTYKMLFRQFFWPGASRQVR
jgi:hypothetical protein